MSCKVLYCGLAGVFVVLVLTAGLVSTAHAVVIAEWNFDDPNDLLADSSGNGNDLVQIGTVYYGPDPYHVSGVAAFDAGPGRLATSAALDLSPYRHVRVSWSMRCLTDALGVVFDHSWTGSGLSGWIVDTNTNGGVIPGNGSAGVVERPDNTYTFTGYTHEHGTANEVWADYAVEFDLNAALPADYIKVFKNGVNIGTPPPSLALLVEMPNDIFTIGALQLGGIAYVGNLDSIKLEYIIVPRPGDANSDEIVNEQDLADLESNWLAGPGATWAMGDFNDDGFVNDIDATMLATNWQGTTSAGGSVPEPATIVFFASAAIAILMMRRRRRLC